MLTYCLSSSLFHLKQWQQDHGGASWPVLPMEFPEHTPFLPVEPDNTGRWTAHNPAVWRRLDPILRLVTRFLNHSAATDWVCYSIAIKAFPSGCSWLTS